MLKWVSFITILCQNHKAYIPLSSWNVLQHSRWVLHYTRMKKKLISTH